MNLKDVSYYTVSNIINKASNVLLYLGLPKLLEINIYGEFILYYALYQVFILFSSAGIYENIIQKEDNENNIGWTLQTLYNGFIISITLGILFFSFNPYFNYISIEPSYFLFISLCGSISSTAFMESKRLITENKLLKSSIYNLVNITVPNIIGFVLVYIYSDFNLVFYSIIVINGILIIYILYSNEINYIKIKVKSAKVYYYKLFPYAVLAVIGWLGGYGFNYLIKTKYSNEVVGAFSIILSYANLSLIVVNSTNTMWMAKLSKYINEGKDYVKIDYDFYKKLAIGFTGIVSLMILLFPLFTEIYNKEIIHLQSNVKYIVLAYLFYIPSWQLKNRYYILGMQFRLLKAIGYSGVVGMLLSLIIIYYWRDTTGIYIAFLINLNIQTLVLHYFSKDIINIKYPVKLIMICTLIIVIIDYII